MTVEVRWQVGGYVIDGARAAGCFSPPPWRRILIPVPFAQAQVWHLNL
jgi:hypothetical protein